MIMKINIFILIAILVAIISSIFFLYFRTPPPDLKTFSSDKNVFLECRAIEDRAKRYACFKDVALYALENGASVDELAQYTEGGHLQYHSIGRAMLIVSDYNLEEAIKKCRPNCNGAYYHAIAEEWGEYAPLRQERFIDFLNSTCPLEESASAVGCYHNVGHFYVVANKSFEKSLALCNELPDSDRFYQCTYGAVHEEFIQSDNENFFQLCSNYTDRRRVACYSMGSAVYPKWLSYKLNSKFPLEICDGLNSEIPVELNYCYASAAWVLESKGETPDPAWCERLDAEFKELCINSLESPKPFWDVFGCRATGVHEENIIGCGLQ